MSEATFHAFTRQSDDSISRQRSLLTLGSAALIAAFARPAVTDAGKTGKRAKKKCKKQRGQCEASVARFCEAEEEGPECTEPRLPCCAFFANCQAGQGLQCLIDAAQAM